MRKLILFAFLCTIFLAELSGCTLTMVDDTPMDGRRCGLSCISGEYDTNQWGCVEDCGKLLRDTDCSNSVDAGVCGVNRDGIWRSYRSACSACNQHNSGYFNKKCEDLIALKKCENPKLLKIQFDEKCNVRKCDKICRGQICPLGFDCIQEKCQKRCRVDSQCAAYEKCNIPNKAFGVCVSKCAGVVCPTDNICAQDGTCQPFKCTTSPGSCVQTSFGRVAKISISSPIFFGWRKLKIEEGRTIKDILDRMLGYWSVVAFQTGKLDGRGYGNKFSEVYGQEAGEVFIVEISPLSGP